MSGGGVGGGTRPIIAATSDGDSQSKRAMSDCRAPPPR